VENGRARSKVARLGVRLRVWPASGSADSEGEYFGIDSLVEYDWQSALGRFKHSSIHRHGAEQLQSHLLPSQRDERPPEQGRVDSVHAKILREIRG